LLLCGDGELFVTAEAQSETQSEFDLCDADRGLEYRKVFKHRNLLAYSLTADKQLKVFAILKQISLVFENCFRDQVIGFKLGGL
jgi:hypothetical protein